MGKGEGRKEWERWRRKEEGKRERGGKLVKKCFGLRKLLNFEKEKLIINQKKNPNLTFK